MSRRRKKDTLNGFRGVLLFMAFSFTFIVCCGFITFLTYIAYIVSKIL